MKDWDMSRLAFPRGHRALKGWRSAAPESTMEPAAWEAVVVGAAVLASQPGLNAFGPRVAFGAARGALLQFGTYARPSEMLKLRGKD